MKQLVEICDRHKEIKQYLWSDSDCYCESCLEEQAHYCSGCDETHDELISQFGQTYCRQCMEAYMDNYRGNLS